MTSTVTSTMTRPKPGSLELQVRNEVEAVLCNNPFLEPNHGRPSTLQALPVEPLEGEALLNSAANAKDQDFSSWAEYEPDRTMIWALGEPRINVRRLRMEYQFPQKKNMVHILRMVDKWSCNSYMSAFPCCLTSCPNCAVVLSFSSLSSVVIVVMVTA